jgi:aminoglycoside 2''-phosphotransferase
MGLWLTESDVSRLTRAVLASWPQAALTKLTLLGEGFGSVALESDDGVVVLVAKNAIGAESRKLCVRLLPELAPTLPTAIPEPFWHTETEEGLPFGAYAYRKLPGRMLPSEEPPTAMARDVAAFLYAIHTFPTERAKPLGVPGVEDFRRDLLSLRVETMPALRERLSGSEVAKIETWWHAFLDDPATTPEAPALIHGDLWPDNLLVDESSSRLLGVIDFGDAAIGDVAHDFAVLRHLGEPFVDQCLQEYIALGGATGGGLVHRMDRYWELRTGGFYSIRAAVREEDEGELNDCLSKLRNGPILSNA